MSRLSHIDRLRLEKFFGMNTGYVLDFSNRTFQDFILEATSKDIYEDKYGTLGSSKANHLRSFWNLEPTYVVSKLTRSMLDHWRSSTSLRNSATTKEEENLFEECKQIVGNLDRGDLAENIEVIQPNSEEKDFSVLAKAIRKSIEENEPGMALDRLHTFVVKFVRELCDKHVIQYDKNKALHSFFGEYVRKLKERNLIESQMTERILKTSISVLEAFNDVRNNQSLAHDNPMLNYDESMLIFRNISSIIEFLKSVEMNIASAQSKAAASTATDELPF